MWTNNQTFDFSKWYLNGPGLSEFGAAHGPGILIAPELPETTSELIGVDLTHVIHTSDIASAKGGNGGGGGGTRGGGGGDTGSTGFDPVTFTSHMGSITGTGDPANEYNITIMFKGSWTETLYNDFVDAANRLTSFIFDDVQDVSVVGLKGGPQTVDDIVISAELTTIDGEGGVLGQAGPTSIRSNGYLPATAIMQFDIADASYYEGINLFDDIVLHEMSHSLGFGSIWSYLGLVDTNSYFIGANAVAQYQNLGGALYGIPVETDGGSGTAGSHWDEATFDNELMTGYIDSTNYFSEMSVASFADLGYGLSSNFLAAADPGYSFA